MNIMDPQYRKEISAIMADTTLTTNRKRVAAGKAIRHAVFRLKDDDKSTTEIADLLGIPEDRVRRVINMGRPLPRNN